MHARPVLLLLLALSACHPGEPPAKAAAMVNPDPGVRAYQCEDGRVVEAGYPDASSAVVKVDGRPYPLTAAAAASGVRYVGFGLQWWAKGAHEARLARLKDGESIASDPGVLCRAGPEQP